MQKLRRILCTAAIVLFALATTLLAVACDKSYTLKFETNGGNEIASITAAEGEAITPPADPVRENFGFDGWYLSSDFSGEAVQLPSVMPGKNTTYYAKWSDRVTLTFITEGAVPVSPITAHPGEAITPPANPQKGGHTFDGWYTNASFEGDPVESLPTTMPSTNVTYYAKFTRQLSVSYRFNLWKTDSYGMPTVEVEHTGDVAKQDCKLGDSVVVKENGFQVEGYKFLGWSTKKDGPINYPAEGYDKADGQYAAGDTIKIESEANVVLYAHWMQYFTNKSEDYTIGIADTVGIGKEGSAIYIDKAGHETLGSVVLTPAYDWEYTIEVGSNTYVGRVDDSDTDGAVFEPQSEALKDKAGYYRFYDWPTGQYEGADLFISGYSSPAGGSFGLPGESGAAEQYFGALLYENEEFQITITKIAEDDEHYDLVGLNEQLSTGNFTTPFVLFSVDIDWEYKADGEVEGVTVKGSYAIGGEEGSSESLKSQSYMWIFADEDGSLGYENYLYNCAMKLDGFGNATVYKIDTSGETPRLVEDYHGTYRGNGEHYENVYGEWTFTPEAGHGEPFNFILDGTQTSDGSVYYYYLKVVRIQYTSGDNTFETVSTGAASYTASGTTVTGMYEMITDDVALFMDADANFRYFKLTESQSAKTFKEYTKPDSGDFWIEGNVLLSYLGKSEGAVKVPDGVTEIAGYAFLLAPISEIDLNGVTKINANAFIGCANLAKVTATNVQYIGDNAFMYFAASASDVYLCSALTELELPAIVEIGATAFIGASALTKVTLGENLAAIGAGAFAAVVSGASSFTLIFEGTTPPAIDDVEGSALLVYGRSGVSFEVSSSETLIKYWNEGKDKGWENYISYLTFEYTDAELKSLKSYFGAYFAEDFNSIQLSETGATVHGAPALVLWDTDSSQPKVYVYNDGEAELLEFTFDYNTVTNNQGTTTQKFNGKITHGAKDYYNLLKFDSDNTEVTLTNSKTGERLVFEFDPDYGQFEIYDAKYTPPATETDDEGNPLPAEDVVLMLVYLYDEKTGANKLTVGFVRGGSASYGYADGSLYLLTEYAWSHSDFTGTFAAEFQEETSQIYSYDYLKQTTYLEDLLFMVRKDYDLSNADLYLRGVLQTLQDQNGNPLVIDDETFTIDLSMSTVGDIYGWLEFVYDGYKAKDYGTEEDYEGDGCLYTMLFRIVTVTVDGEEVDAFQYIYAVAEPFAFENVTVGSDEYAVTVYTYLGGNMYDDDTAEGPAKGDLFHVIATDKEGDSLNFIDMAQDEENKNVYTLYALSEDPENEGELLQTEYTLTLTWDKKEVGDGDDMTTVDYVSGVTLEKGETTPYVPSTQDTPAEDAE